MIDLIVQAHIEDRRRELDKCLRGAEAARFARLSAAPRNHWLKSLLRSGQRARRASSAAFAAGHSASSIE